MSLIKTVLKSAKQQYAPTGCPLKKLSLINHTGCIWQMEYRWDETSHPQIAHLSAPLFRNKRSKPHCKMFFGLHYRMLIKFELNSIIRFWWAKQEFGIYGWLMSDGGELVAK